MIKKSPAHINPGTNVAINKAPTYAEDTDAKIIAFTFGGIIKPKGLEAAINAAKYALSYPFFSNSGTIAVDSVLAVANAEPQRAPKKQETTGIVAVNPPFTLCSILSATRISTFAIPLRSIKEPPTIKSGIANIEIEFKM